MTKCALPLGSPHRILLHCGPPEAFVRAAAGAEIVDREWRIDAVEVRGDLLFVTGDRGPWFLVEVQLDKDDAKARRWPLMTALLLDERGTMGDLVVITAQRHVAQWAASVADASGPMGTRLILTPIVILLDGKEAERFLDPEQPELCFLAAWTMHDRRGVEAQRVIDRCFALVDTIADRDLQKSLVRAIYNVLSDTLAERYKELVMGLQSMPESPAFKALREELEARGRAEGKAEGKAEGEIRGKSAALIAVLEARMITIDEGGRARIESTRDSAQLDRWLRRAVTAASITELFASD